MSATRPKPRPGLLDIAPYVPGKSSAPGVAKVFKLSSNETPLGPSPKAIAAYQAAGAHLEDYPDGSASDLREAIGRAFGMQVLFADHPPPKMQGVLFTPLDEVLARSDVISLHCPLLPATRNLIDIQAFRKMRRNALLINTARGGLVDEAALIQALDEGLIAGAGFDVLTVEPPKNGNPLLDVRRPNFILTPHIAWASDGAMQFLADQLVDNIDHGHHANRNIW